MSAVPFHYVDLRAFCYATEDDQRVEQALRTFLPEDTPIDRATTEGHLGDEILVLSTRLETADDIRYVLGRLTALADLQPLLEELDDRVDDNCAFFVQLDKQAAYRGEIERGRGIMLRAKVEAYPANRETAVENAREAIQALAETATADE